MSLIWDRDYFEFESDLDLVFDVVSEFDPESDFQSELEFEVEFDFELVLGLHSESEFKF